MKKFAKLSCLIIKLGTEALRCFLTQHVLKGSTLKQFLSANSTLLTSFYKPAKGQRRLLTHPQYILLFPPGGADPDMTSFDITLLFFLSRQFYDRHNYPPRWKGWDAPSVAHSSGIPQHLQDAVTIKFHRNQVAHSQTTDMSGSDFEKVWQTVSEAVVRLGISQTAVDDLKKSAIDPEQEESYHAELRRQYLEEKEIKELLEDKFTELASLMKQSVAESSSQHALSEQILPSAFTRGVTVSVNTQELVEKVQGELKDWYLTSTTKLNPIPWCEEFNSLHVADVFTNLEIYKSSENVHLEDIFCGTSGKVPKRLVVSGSPGSGKTTLCRKLAFDWANPDTIPYQIHHFHFLFLLEARHLTGRIEDALFEDLLPEDICVDKEAFYSHMRSNQDKILFIIDGYDELKDVQSTNLKQLIKKSIFRHSSVLITTRPECLQELLQYSEKHMVNKGFTTENAKHFVRKYFPGKEEVFMDRVFSFLDTNRFVKELVTTPLNVVLLCIIWEDQNYQMPASMTELYHEIIYSIARRYCSKHNTLMSGSDLPEDIEGYINEICRLAFEGIRQNCLGFDIKELNRLSVHQEARALGFLNKELSVARIRRTEVYSFPHKSVQEFLAASWIIRLSLSDFLSGLDVALARRIRNLLVFMGGLFAKKQDADNSSLLLKILIDDFPKEWKWEVFEEMYNVNASVALSGCLPWKIRLNVDSSFTKERMVQCLITEDAASPKVMVIEGASNRHFLGLTELLRTKTEIPNLKSLYLKLMPSLKGMCKNGGVFSVPCPFGMETLVLSLKYLRRVGVVSLVGSGESGNSTLKRLCIHEEPEATGWGVTLAAFNSSIAQNLTYLSLANIRMIDEDLAKLLDTGLRENRHLLWLDLSRNRLTLDSISKVILCVWFKNLVCFDVSRNTADAWGIWESLIRYGGLIKTSPLLYLGLAGNGVVHPVHMSELLKDLPKTSLVELHVHAAIERQIFTRYDQGIRYICICKVGHDDLPLCLKVNAQVPHDTYVQDIRDVNEGHLKAESMRHPNGLCPVCSGMRFEDDGYVSVREVCSEMSHPLNIGREIYMLS